MTCLSCGRSSVAESNFCAFCGASLPAADRATAPLLERTVLPPQYSGTDDRRVSTPERGARTPTSAGASSATFPPGTLLTDRYRIVARIGQGGMGEVYRADDLVLEQSVALKFLPSEIVRDSDRLARFRSEVRVARQISHPNVCRVYDIAEANGHTFLTMEHIDGENLGSLLRRIGRLPHDTALDMARQLCGGLAAAHDKNVLHRDLKPANVMIDGTGKVKLADFGLATLATDHESASLAGTPAYMAPELFDQLPPTAKSDIYALGLVLYEMFTGKPAFQSTSVAELARLHHETTPSSLSNVLADADASVERVIQRCLSKDPNERPASARSVAAALPGGDPLAAAVAAGETPSPELVAAAGGVGAIRPIVGAICVAALILGLFLVVSLSGSTQAVRYVPLDRAPEVLADQARSMLTRFGFRDAPAAVASGFATTRYASYLRQNDHSPNRWDNLKVGQPPEYVYWYRQSPQRLTTDRWSLGGRITPTDPPHDVPGMVIVMIDPKGRLHQLVAVPAAQQAAAVRPAPDWSALFREAGLDLTTFTATTPTWIPPTYADTRAAWDGVYPDNAQAKVHIEAASVDGRPTFFRIYQPWDQPDQAASTTSRNATAATGLTIRVIVLVGAAVLARRNIRLGRGDQAGAMRLAVVLCVIQLSTGLLRASDDLTLSTLMPTLTVVFALALLLSAIVWMTYVALEPDLRRRAPEMLIAWSRLLSGRFSDPLVGRSLLVGLTAGVVGQILWQLQLLSPRWAGQAPDVSFPLGGAPASTVSEAVASLFGAWTAAVVVVTSLTFLLLLVLLLVRRRSWAGVALFLLLMSVSMIGRPLNVSVVFHVLNNLLVTLVLIRFGVLASVVSAYVNPVLDHVPMTFDSSVWYVSHSWLALAVMIALAIVGYRIAVAGRPLVGSTWLDA